LRFARPLHPEVGFQHLAPPDVCSTVEAAERLRFRVDRSSIPNNIANLAALDV
jgi:hypothetical protein